MLAAAIVAVVALVIVALVAWPLLEGRPDASAPDPADDLRRELGAQLEASLEAIREIEMDHRAGNLSDADFAELDRVERARAVELMRRVDALAEGDPGPGGPGAAGAGGTAEG